MPPRHIFGLCLFFLLGSSAASAAAPAERRASAGALVAVAERAVASVAEVSLADPRIVPATRFWDALDATRRALGEFGGSLGAPSPALFRSLGEVTRRASEVRGEWQTLGLVEPRIVDKLAILDLAVEALRAHCGWEAARLRRGGELSPEEQRRLAALQVAESRLARELAAARDHAARVGDSETAEHLARMIALARQSAAEEATLEALARAGYLADRLRGEWSALARRPSIAASRERERIEPVVEKLVTDAEAGYVFALDLSGASGVEASQAGSATSSQSWSFLEEPIDLGGDLSRLADEVEFEAQGDSESDGEGELIEELAEEVAEEQAESQLDDQPEATSDETPDEDQPVDEQEPAEGEARTATDESEPLDPEAPALPQSNSCGPDDCPSPFDFAPPLETPSEPPPARERGDAAIHSNIS